MGMKGVTEEHKMQINIKHLVLTMSQRKKKKKKTSETSGQTFTVSVVNKTVKSTNLWKIGWWAACQDLCSYYHKNHGISPRTEQKHYEWYQACDLNKYFENVKDTITLTMKVKGYNEIKKITEENMLSQASSMAFKQTGL